MSIENDTKAETLIVECGMYDVQSGITSERKYLIGRDVDVSSRTAHVPTRVRRTLSRIINPGLVHVEQRVRWAREKYNFLRYATQVEFNSHVEKLYKSDAPYVQLKIAHCHLFNDHNVSFNNFSEQKEK